MCLVLLCQGMGVSMDMDMGMAMGMDMGMRWGMGLWVGIDDVQVLHAKATRSEANNLVKVGKGRSSILHLLHCLLLLLLLLLLLQVSKSTYLSH